MPTDAGGQDIPSDILAVAAQALEPGSLHGVAQAILAERKRCADIARTITSNEAKVLILPERLEYWEDLGCHVKAGERFRIDFRNAIAQKIMRPDEWPTVDFGN